MKTKRKIREKSKDQFWKTLLQQTLPSCKFVCRKCVQSLCTFQKRYTQKIRAVCTAMWGKCTKKNEHTDTDTHTNTGLHEGVHNKQTKFCRLSLVCACVCASVLVSVCLHAFFLRVAVLFSICLSSAIAVYMHSKCQSETNGKSSLIFRHIKRATAATAYDEEEIKKKMDKGAQHVTKMHSNNLK